MARHTGLDGAVYIDGTAVAHITGWSMAYRGDILRHRGASEGVTTKYIGESERAGRFDCEADPADATQSGMMAGGVQRVTLVLTEVAGTTHTFDAIVTPSTNVPRSGAVTRSFEFEETA